MNSIFLISDFNAEPLARYLLNNNEESMSVETAPFGQVFQSLAGKENYDGGIVWTLPEKVIPTFARAIEFSKIDVESCLNEVAVFADAVLDFSMRHQYVFVASWVIAADSRGYGILDWRNGLGLKNLLARMNLHLADLLGDASNVYILDAAHWSATISQMTSPKMWYAAKVPYSNAVFENAAMDMSAAINTLAGKSRKLIIVDLDNTLWGGVVGETGWQGIRLGGHDFVGEAFCDFQRCLRALSRRGIQLAIVSKNDEVVALEAIDKHSEMLLQRDDFAGWRINWHDKAENIASLVEELNLGLDSVVFIDDNPTERDRVRGAFPQILVPEWPEDPTAYASTLRKLNCFDTAALSNEDRMRTEMYATERGR
ncbi:MAG: HAD-IIIC family phosphatase, partial [Flavobacteriales bacterium]|nr:HAD-IIIC family phosphatase [Flavobacteriales bacterium]